MTRVPGRVTTGRALTPARDRGAPVDGEVDEPAAPAELEPPATSGDALVWLGAAVAGYAAGTLVGLVLLEVVADALGKSHTLPQLVAAASPPAWVIVCDLVGLWTGFVGAVVAVSRLRGRRRLIDDMGLRFRWVDLPLGIVVGVVGQELLVPALYWPLAHLAHIHDLQQRLNQPAQRLTDGFVGGDLAVIAVLTVVVVPFVEELFFRGLILRAFVRLCGRFGRAVGPTVAVVLTGIIFGLAHWEPLQLLGLATFGVALSVLAYRTRRLGSSIVAHASFNLVAILAVAWPHNGPF